MFKLQRDRVGIVRVVRIVILETPTPGPFDLKRITLLLINDTTSVIQYTVKYKPGAHFSGFVDWSTWWRPAMSQGNAFWGRDILVPLWIPTVLFAAMFWWSFLPLRRRRKRKKLGLCRKCGYDLRASKERCPECGMLVERGRGPSGTAHKGESMTL